MTATDSSRTRPAEPLSGDEPPAPVRLDPLGELLRACAHGDEKALARLYRLTSPKLFALALSILRRRPEAEEALQEAFVSIWGNAHRFEPARGSAMTWMVTIVRNRALTSLRRRPPEADARVDQLILRDDGPDPLESALRSSEARRIMTCLERLDAEQRRSIVLAYVHGFTHQELSRRLDVPLGTVKSWIRRGLISLRDCLDHG